MKKPIALASLVALTACGGALPPLSPTLPPLSPAALTNGPAGPGLGGNVPPTGAPALTYNNGTLFTGVTKIVTGATSYGQGALAAADGTSFDVIGFSDDGKVAPGDPNVISATIIGSATGSEGGAAGFGQHAVYSRDSQSVLPTSGTAEVFNGEYRGVIGADNQSFNGHTAGAQVAITGDAQLTANFKNSMISGTIKNRQTLLSGGGTDMSFADVTLSNTAINGSGAFNSTASGGAATGGTASNGTYKGLIGGANGTGIAGALGMDHLIGGTTFTELGVFTGTRP